MPFENTKAKATDPPGLLAQHQACMTINGDNDAVRAGLGNLMSMQPVLDLSDDVSSASLVALPSRPLMVAGGDGKFDPSLSDR